MSVMVWSRHSLQAVQQHNDHGDHTISLEGQRTSTHLQGKGRHPRVQELQRDQAPALSPYLFLILMDVLTERVRKEAPESMLFADYIVLCGDKVVDMTEYLESWRKALEEREMRVSRPKTQFMDFSFEQNAHGNRPQVKILDEEVERLTHFKYLGTSIEDEEGMETEIAKRVGAGWMNWKKCSGVLCDKRMPVKLK